MLELYYSCISYNRINLCVQNKNYFVRMLSFFLKMAYYIKHDNNQSIENNVIYNLHHILHFLTLFMILNRLYANKTPFQNYYLFVR